MPLPAHRLRRLLLAATAAASLLARRVSAQVDCGGHIAVDCGGCPKDDNSGAFYAQAWCNGECRWIDPHWLGIRGGCFNRDIQENTGGAAVEYGVWFLLCAVVMLLFACVYKGKVVNKLHVMIPHTATSDGEQRVREKGLCACFSDMDTCLYTTCCLPIVAAKSYHVAGICNFWPGCCLMFLGTYTPFCAIAMMVRGALSGRVREKMGYTPHFLTDCALSCFCFPCEVGRESMEIDEEIGVHISCCYPHVEKEEREPLPEEKSPLNSKKSLSGVLPEAAAEEDERHGGRTCDTNPTQSCMGRQREATQDSNTSKEGQREAAPDSKSWWSWLSRGSGDQEPAADEVGQGH